MIGHVYFCQAEPPKFLTWELGYIFNPAYWGKGYATEACRRILQYGFEELGAHRIMARCSPENEASWRLLERLSMRREGFFKKCATFRQDEFGTEMDGKPAGCVMCVRSTDEVAKLRVLLVDPSARGRGIGTRLIDECVAFAKRARYKKMVLWTSSILIEARRLYANAGFAPVAEEAERSFGHDLLMETWELTL